jgi:hypothetical protein
MLQVVRRLAAILMLVVPAGLLLAACAGNDHRTDGTTAGKSVPPAAQAPAGADKSPTKAQAIAFAHAVNLTAADVPGFTATSEHGHEHETAAGKRLEHELQQCTGGTLTSHSGLAEVNSPHFKLQRSVLSFGVESKVSVAQTPIQATRELKSMRGNHIRGCLSHYLSALLRDQLIKEKSYPGAIPPVSISISQGTPPSPGATGSFGWRVTATITVRGVKLPFYMDILGFAYGRAEVSLISTGALRPFPAAAQEHLYWLLLKRAEAHSL